MLAVADAELSPSPAKCALFGRAPAGVGARAPRASTRRDETRGARRRRFVVVGALRMERNKKRSNQKENSKK